MKTLILNADLPEDIEAAANALRQGRLVVFPTDTVYGVGATVGREAAIAALYEVKRRPATKGIPLLLSSAAELDSVTPAINTMTRLLAARFWPGPLSLIVLRRQSLPANLSPNAGLAVRVPDDDRARALIALAGGAIAATSANISGMPPARSAAEAWAQLEGRVAFILDGGPAPLAQPSTIVDCLATPPRIIRPGPISAAQIKAVLTADRATGV